MYHVTFIAKSGSGCHPEKSHDTFLPIQNATVYAHCHPRLNSHKVLNNGPFHSNNIAVELINVQYFESKLLFSETTMEQKYKLLFTYWLL